MTSEIVRAALDACFEAVPIPDAFPGALHRLARSLDAVCMMFYARDARDQFLRLPASPDFLDFLGEFVRDGWWARDHRADRGFPLFERHRRLVLTEHDIADESDRRSLPQYHDLYPKYDVPWWAGVSYKVEGRLWVVPFLRSATQGAFGQSDVRTLMGIVPNFERMTAFASRVANVQGSAALSVLDAGAKPAALLDWQGRICMMNAAAERLMGTDLRVSSRRIWASDAESNRDLQAIVDKAIAATTPSSLQADGPAVIRRQGKKPLLIDAIPAVGVLQDAFLHVRVFLMFTDLEERRTGLEIRLRKVYGLTPNEIRIATEVGAGRSPKEVADATGTTLGTIRSVLHHVYEKLDIAGQPELVRTVERLGHHSR